MLFWEDCEVLVAAISPSARALTTLCSSIRRCHDGEHLQPWGGFFTKKKKWVRAKTRSEKLGLCSQLLYVVSAYVLQALNWNLFCCCIFLTFGEATRAGLDIHCYRNTSDSPKTNICDTEFLLLWECQSAYAYPWILTPIIYSRILSICRRLRKRNNSITDTWKMGRSLG